MDKNEYKDFKRHLDNLNLEGSDKLKYEIKDLTSRLKKAEGDFNEYKLFVSCTLAPKYDNIRQMMDSIKRELGNERLKNDSLIDFILENGLGKKYYHHFVEEFYPYDSLDFKTKNEVSFEDISMSNNGQMEMKGRILNMLDQLPTKN